MFSQANPAPFFIGSNQKGASKGYFTDGILSSLSSSLLWHRRLGMGVHLGLGGSEWSMLIFTVSGFILFCLYIMLLSQHYLYYQFYLLFGHKIQCAMASWRELIYKFTFYILQWIMVLFSFSRFQPWNTDTQVINYTESKSREVGTICLSAFIYWQQQAKMQEWF